MFDSIPFRYLGDYYIFEIFIGYLVISIHFSYPNSFFSKCVPLSFDYPLIHADTLFLIPLIFYCHTPLHCSSFLWFSIVTCSHSSSFLWYFIVTCSCIVPHSFDLLLLHAASLFLIPLIFYCYTLLHCSSFLWSTVVTCSFIVPHSLDLLLLYAATVPHSFYLPWSHPTTLFLIPLIFYCYRCVRK